MVGPAAMGSHPGVSMLGWLVPFSQVEGREFSQPQILFSICRPKCFPGLRAHGIILAYSGSPSPEEPRDEFAYPDSPEASADCTRELVRAKYRA